uniref:Cullin family profile domain-containing protein n=1 Tax=Triticum aestivum TaxID=4565 RepID=A0A3B6MZ05_WHEAT
MSHPHASAPKRPFSSSSPSPASPAPPHMKKAKLPASSSSSAGPTEKSGLHLDPAAAAAVRGGGRTNGEEDVDMLLADQDELRAPNASAPGGGTANLFRKKATLPQPPATAATRKPLRIKIGQPKLPKNFEEDTWAILKDAITAIFLKQKLSCDVEKLYQAAGDLCLHKLGANLYERVKKECEIHISAKISALVGQSPDLVVFLSLVQRTWQDFCDQMLIIRGIALLLDVKYVKNVANLCSVWDMGLQLFRKHISLSPEIEHKTVTGLLRLIESERLGEAIDKTLLSHLLKMFTDLGMYSETFEKPFLECTSEFYATEGVKYLQQSDIPDYLRHAESRLQEEHDRCILYLEANTRKPLIATTEKQLLQRHTSAIIEKGFTVLMEANRVTDLSRMYTLFQRVDAIEMLKQALSLYIRGTGQGIIMDEEKDKDLVPFLLEFKASLDKILEESFAKNEAFSNTIKESFEHLINLRQNRPAELIAKFLDEKLRAGNKGTSEEELEGILDKVLVLFRFIQGKDVFEAFYKKDLAKRLLLGKSASIDAEKSMITKLKTECGSQFTNKLEGMFKDIELSKEINDSFKQSSQARTKLPTGIEMSVHVLTTGYWPTYPPMDVKLPHELNVYQDIFKEFYLSKYSGRRLMWQNSLGHCVLKVEFPKECSPDVVQRCSKAKLCRHKGVDWY